MKREVPFEFAIAQVDFRAPGALCGRSFFGFVRATAQRGGLALQRTRLAKRLANEAGVLWSPNRRKRRCRGDWIRDTEAHFGSAGTNDQFAKQELLACARSCRGDDEVSRINLRLVRLRSLPLQYPRFRLCDSNQFESRESARPQPFLVRPRRFSSVRCRMDRTNAGKIPETAGLNAHELTNLPGEHTFGRCKFGTSSGCWKP